MNKTDLAAARVELNKMSKLAKAFENAEAVVVLLESASQLELEIAKATSDGRAELDKLKDDQAKAVAAKKAAETSFAVQKKTAQEACEAMLTAAKADAAKVLSASAEAAKEAAAKNAAASDELATLNAQKASVAAELTALNKQIEQTKAQVRKILQGA
jgi:chromosome segregation ATPase